MKSLSRGFTLIETVIATAILAVASFAIASLFTSSLRTNVHNRDRTGAGLILSDKVEELNVIRLSNSHWLAGDYMDYVSVGADGSLITSPTDSTLKFLRTWRISTTQPQTLTVIVYSNHSAMTGRPMELIRTTVVSAPRW
jgi:prepilin-type N-terminal cleavage/methylation domain-containing protein